MKKTFYMILAAAFFIAGCQKKEEQPGSIYGSVSDKATGELIKTAAVELQPGGTKHQTGTDGYFEIQNLKAGNYTLNVSKTGYSDVINYQVSVENGKTTRIDVPMEKLPPALRIVNDKGENIDEIDFGSDISVVERSFSIFNDSPESLEWIITKNCTWITNISKTSGTLPAGKPQPIIITIDREKLNAGENSSFLNFSSDNGTKELKIKAVGETKILPTLNTLAATSITTTTATLNGEILTDGTPAYTERGFVYSLSSMPTLETTIAKITASVTSNNTYSAPISGLTSDKTYYVRAYAVNKAGKAYSTNEINFKTERKLASVTTQEVINKNISAGTATFIGSIVNIGDPGYTERGFVYGLSKNPTVESDTKKTVSGSGTGEFSYNASGLTVGKIYYVRAYATNSLGTAYGAEKVCDFSAIMPEVTTQDVSNKKIGDGTATFNGTIVKIGDPSYTKRGFVYGLTQNPTIEYDTVKTVSGTGTGTYSYNAKGLTVGKVYYIRAYATNAQGTAYGNQITCDFNAVKAEVSTQDVTNKKISAGTATFTGSIVKIGDPAYTERGFVYGLTHNPTIEYDTKKTVGGSIQTGTYSYSAAALQPGSIYYVRAYVLQNGQPIYGTEKVCDFTPVAPNVTTSAATKIDANKATLNGSISSVGDPAYTKRGFVYGTNNTPTIGNGTNKEVAGTGTGSYNVDITGLTPGETYYFRAYAINGAEPKYGAILSFKAESPYYVILETAKLMVQKTDIGIGTWLSMNSLCNNSLLAGLDWRMPTKNELALLYNECNNIGGFVTTYSNTSKYWSSTAYSIYNYWYQDFSSGEQNSDNKDYNAYRCRCVRTYTP